MLRLKLRKVFITSNQFAMHDKTNCIIKHHLNNPNKLKNYL